MTSPSALLTPPLDRHEPLIAPPSSQLTALLIALCSLALSLCGCQHEGERPLERQGVFIELKSDSVSVSATQARRFMSAVSELPDVQDLLQRAILTEHIQHKLKAQRSAKGAQRALETEAPPLLREEIKGAVSSWTALIKLAAELSEPLDDEALRRRFEARYPSGQRLLGEQLLWSAPERWGEEQRRGFKRALTSWAQRHLQRAQQDLLSGASPETLAERFQLSLKEGEALSQHLQPQARAHARALISRLRVGERSPSLTSERDVCFYVKCSAPQGEASQGEAPQNSAPTPHAVTLPTRSPTEAQASSRVTALCLELTLEGLKKGAARSFDTTLRAELLKLAQLNALNAESARALQLELSPLSPHEWPASLRERVLQARDLTGAQELIKEGGWLIEALPQQLWFVKVTGREPVSFEQVREELRRQTLDDERRGQLTLEQLWEELSPELKLYEVNAQTPLSAPSASHPKTLMLPPLKLKRLKRQPPL